jgi:hypothetical protein
MRPWQFMLLRLFAYTLGRVGVCALLLHRALVRILVWRARGRRYSPASRYFDAALLRAHPINQKERE